MIEKRQKTRVILHMVYPSRYYMWLSILYHTVCQRVLLGYTSFWCSLLISK